MSKSKSNYSKDTLHIYSRVSSEQQDTKGFSLENQIKNGIKFSENKGFKNYVVHNEKHSSSFGDLGDRDVISDLLIQIDEGKIKYLYVTDLDRLSRNRISSSIILNKLEVNKVTLFVSGSSYNLKDEYDELLVGILSYISTFDNKQRMRRFRQNKIRKFLNGYYVHGTLVFGFDKVRDDKDVGWVLKKNTEQSKVVKKIFTMYSQGSGITDIQKYLLKNKIKTSRGKDFWSSKQIHDMLKRELYIGKTSWNDKHLDKTFYGECQRIIDDKLWFEVKSRLVDTKIKSSILSHQKKHKYLLSGLLYCGVCNYLMRGKTNMKIYRNLYFCGSKNERYRNRSLDKCDKIKSKSVNVKRLDDLVYNTLIDTLDNSSTIKEMMKKKFIGEGKKSREDTLKKLLRDKNKKMKLVRDELKRNETKILDIVNMYVEETIDKQQLDDFVKKIEIKNVDLKTQLHSIDVDKKRLLQNRQWIDWINKYKEKSDYYKGLEDFDEKRKLVQDYIKSVKVDYDDINQHHNVNIELHLKIFDDKYVVKGKNKSGRVYEVVEGSNTKSFFLNKTKVGRKTKVS